MGYDLKALRDGEKFSWRLFYWPRVLDLARIYGWKPAGTLPPRSWPRGKPWNDAYHANDGGIVTAADALALAGAVERFLPDLPRASRYPDGIPLSQLAWDRGFIVAMLSGEPERARLEAFAAYCRRSGGLEIW